MQDQIDQSVESAEVVKPASEIVEAEPTEAVEIAEPAIAVVENPREGKTAWEILMELAEVFGGDVEVGNFKGTIRLEPGVNADREAELIYNAVKLWCYTASISQNVRKDGGVSLRIMVGARRVAEPVEEPIAVESVEVPEEALAIAA